jgi:hypothetical protein
MGVVLALTLAAPAAAQGTDCAEADRAWTTDTLRDLVSFSDQLSIVRGVGESIPPEPDGPEGWAGFITRRVEVEVGRTFWRRPGAPRAPRSFRFIDWGWWGDLDDKRPARVCGGTRLEVGRRYLAPLVRWHGDWFPADTARLLLFDDLVVGGVDDGEPSFAHQELAGRTIRQAVRLVKRTIPYHAAVRHPKLNPPRRWSAVDRDGYRPARKRRGEGVTVAAGVTSTTRWTLHTRPGCRDGWWIGLATRPLWPGRGSSPSGEGCSGPFSARAKLTFGSTGGAGHPTFAYGRAWRTVAYVDVASAGALPVRVSTVPSPKEIGGQDRYWVTPIAELCAGLTVRGYDVRERQVAQIRLPPSRPCGPPLLRIFTSVP